jgi:hypothetical protein
VSGSDRPSVPAALRAELQQEPWARALGVEYLALAPGYSRVALDLAPHMLNHQGAPHGGVVFSLADIALGAASTPTGAVRSRSQLRSAFWPRWLRGRGLSPSAASGGGAGAQPSMAAHRIATRDA